MITIHSNGSKWAGQEPDSLEVLLDVLKREPLNPMFEDYDNFYSYDKPLGPDSEVHCWGNFANLSHGFDIHGLPGELAPLIQAIRENQTREDYRALRRFYRRNLEAQTGKVK